MRRFRKLLILLWTVGLVLMWPRQAPADSLSDLEDSVWGSGMPYVPPSDLTGWFFDPDTAAAFPEAPDPSQPWTSPANIATLNYWLSLVTDMGDPTAMLDQVYLAGMIDAPTVQALDQAETQAGAPEPAGLGLLAAGLLAMGAIVAARTRRLRRYS